MERDTRTMDGDTVGNIRGKGAIVAIDVPSKGFLGRTIRPALERGILTLDCGQRSLRLIPPPGVTEREIGLGAELLVGAIEDTASKRDTLTDPTTAI